MAAGDLFTLAAEFLQACEEAVALAPGGPIDRAFVSAGPPAWDCCPQLTVHVGGPAEGDTAPLQPPLAAGQRASTSGSVHLITMTATVLRCAPTLGDADDETALPSPASLQAAAVDTCGDVWSIWNHIRSRYRADTLFQYANQKRELFFDPAVALNTAGLCAGWQIQIRVQLDGYRETP